jgi:hypothetical protein
LRRSTLRAVRAVIIAGVVSDDEAKTIYPQPGQRRSRLR